MPREINESAIVMFRVFLQQQGGVAVVYAYLGGREDEDFFLTKGLAYTYARLALGVVEQNTVSGRVALNFMKATAAEKGQPVDQKKSIVFCMTWRKVMLTH
ncbi:MAG: hypothetical protein V4749_18920 [Pseudomonadota bacterium]